MYTEHFTSNFRSTSDSRITQLSFGTLITFQFREKANLWSFSFSGSLLGMNFGKTSNFFTTFSVCSPIKTSEQFSHKFVRSGERCCTSQSSGKKSGRSYIAEQFEVGPQPPIVPPRQPPQPPTSPLPIGNAQLFSY